MQLSRATSEDIPAICKLINQAYRGELGWTKETDIVGGERINIEQASALIDTPNAHLLVYRENGELLACICVEADQSSAYIGSFAVQPNIQGRGLGKQVLAAAEEYAAKTLGAKSLCMVVISQREELIAYYERRGYVRSGKVEPYPTHLNVGVPRDTLTIERLEKNISIQ